MQLSEGPLGVLLIGGFHSNSVEVIGLDNCSVPDLPEVRHGHGSFVTGWGSLAVCGGWWDGKPMSSDCLVLNTTSKQWERGILGNLIGSAVLGVVPMNVGTYMVHLTTSSFLPSGEREWIAGPTPPEEVRCAAEISASSFFAFGGKSVRQFDSSIAGPGNDEGWLSGGEWPKLRVKRYRPGCATIDNMFVVAGGHDNLGKLLKSVEIIFLTSKSLGKATNMMKPRGHFNLIVMGTTLLALGGFNETSIEMWEGVGGRWKEASMSLTSSRSHFSALTLTDSVCLPGPIPAHSCPTLDGGTCVFPFTNGRQSKPAKSNHSIFPQGQKLTLPVSVKMTKASGVQLQPKPGPSVTLGNALFLNLVISPTVCIGKC